MFFNILHLTEELLTIVMIQAAEAGITVKHEGCAPEFVYPYVYGSALHVRQIFLNILSNAIKYNRPGGSISCKVQLENHTENVVRYTAIISDTGIGMSWKLHRLCWKMQEQMSVLHETVRKRCRHERSSGKTHYHSKSYSHIGAAQKIEMPGRKCQDKLPVMESAKAE